MWEAAAACEASKGYAPQLVLEFLRARCAGVPGALLLVCACCLLLCIVYGGGGVSWCLNQLQWSPAAAAGQDVLLGGALQLVGTLTDSQLQQTHREAARQDKSGLAVQILADLKTEFGKRFKYTGKV